MCHRQVMWIDARGSKLLSPSECHELLSRAASEIGLGRLGVSAPDAPLVVPVNFTYRGDTVLVRTGDGYVSGLALGRRVAFEVDHVDRKKGEAWSVLVRGLASELSAKALDEQDMPHPLVPLPGDRLVAIPTDVVTGRRFAMRTEDLVKRQSDQGGGLLP
jgi:Pyridoxamine 5'-phosphate oxidase